MTGPAVSGNRAVHSINRPRTQQRPKTEVAPGTFEHAWVSRPSVGKAHGLAHELCNDRRLMDKGAMTAAVAAALVAEQFPQWAELPVAPVASDGWDNTTFRLGDAMSVRLPSHDRYSPQVRKEQEWLPVLAPRLPLPIPEPIAQGRPSGLFPRPWSIYRWREGQPAEADCVSDLSCFAADLADFLAALSASDAGQGPAPGTHNFFRGGSLLTYDAEVRAAIDILADAIDRDIVTALWEAALGSSWDRPPVWVHGDVAPSNLLLVHGQLAAVIDFGCAAVGDPSCDLVMAWTFFSDASRETFQDALAFDAATWTRARGWALWKALITLAREKQRGRGADMVAPRWGWRFTALEVLASLAADYRTLN